MAEKLLGTYKKMLKEVALVPSDGGAFEIIVDGDKIYSKLETGRFPSESTLIEEVKAKL